MLLPVITRKPVGEYTFFPSDLWLSHDCWGLCASGLREKKSNQSSEIKETKWAYNRNQFRFSPLPLLQPTDPNFFTLPKTLDTSLFLIMLQPVHQGTSSTKGLSLRSWMHLTEQQYVMPWDENALRFSINILVSKKRITKSTSWCLMVNYLNILWNLLFVHEITT